MFKLLIGVILGLVVFLCPPTAKVPITRYHGYELNHKAIALGRQFTVLINTTGFGDLMQGSGIIIDPTHVLTCSHLIADKNDLLQVLLYPGYFTNYGKVVYSDGLDDLAILELEVPAHGGELPVFTVKNYDGEPITIIGNMNGSGTWFLSYGIISGRNLRDLYTDGLIMSGNSGGPWINEKGEVLAISDWGLQKNGVDISISGGIKSKIVLQFLDEWRKSRKHEH